VQVGDLIVRFEGLQNPKWADLGDKILISVGEPATVDVERDGKLLHLTLTPRAEGPDRLGYAGFHPMMPGVVETGCTAGLTGAVSVV
jgi:membrane-associated protease RseP (regulator of RpoE activity)